MTETQYVLSIDPGLSTGIALLSYGDHPARLVEGWQFSGGVVGLKRWVEDNWVQAGWDDYNDEPRLAGLVRHVGFLTTEPRWEYGETVPGDDGAVEYTETELAPNLVVIAEKFTARNTKGFSYTTASLEPLRGEGALIALDLMPDYTMSEKRWRNPGGQYLAGGEDLADKKKRQHAFLKDTGFYRTNKDFPDSPPKDQADDFRSACAHGIAYIVKELKHRPTFGLLTDWSNG